MNTVPEIHPEASTVPVAPVRQKPFAEEASLLAELLRTLSAPLEPDSSLSVADRLKVAIAAVGGRTNIERMIRAVNALALRTYDYGPDVLDLDSFEGDEILYVTRVALDASERAATVFAHYRDMLEQKA